MLKRLRVIVCGLAVLVIVSEAGRWAPATAAGALTDLRGVDELKGLFNKDLGKVRLVLLVSPT